MKSTKNKHDRLLNRFYIGLIVIIVLLVMVLFGIRYVQRTFLDTSEKFSMETMLYGKEGLEGNLQRADGFAKNLCVGANNVPLDGVLLNANERAGLFSLDKGEVLFAQSMNEKVYPASITKVMTAILAIKYGNMEDEVIISGNVSNLEEGSQVCGLKPGDKTTLDELFHAMMIFSGNDAAIAIAEHLAGSEEAFVAMMNEEAALLGASQTHFENPHGLHEEGHYTTVYDIYLMLNEALKYEIFVDTMRMPSHNMTIWRGEEKKKLWLDSTDLYLLHQKMPPKDVTILGGKTGTTDEAGSCLALVSQNSCGEPFISVIVNAPSKKILYEDMNQLLSKINL